MSRVEPNRNVYVGHRYVPKIFGEWDKQNEYEGLSIVTHQGTSFTSKKRVPVGIDILNEEFWVVTGNYNAQVEYYREDVRRLEKDTETSLEEMNVKVDKKAEKIYVDDELSKKSDKVYLDNELLKKADKSLMFEELDKKMTTTTENIDIFVEKNGDDNNSGLMSSRPVKTLEKAVSLIPSSIGKDYTFRINIGVGNWSEVLTIKNKNVQGILEIKGTTENRDNHKIYALEFDKINGHTRVSNLYTTTQSRTAFQFSRCAPHVFVTNVRAYGDPESDNSSSGYHGLLADYGSNVQVTYSDFSNKRYGIRCNYLSRIFSSNNTGTGNNFGVGARWGGILQIYGTIPTGSTNKTTDSAGMIIDGKGHSEGIARDDIYLVSSKTSAHDGLVTEREYNVININGGSRPINDDQKIILNFSHVGYGPVKMDINYGGTKNDNFPEFISAIWTGGVSSFIRSQKLSLLHSTSMTQDDIIVENTGDNTFRLVIIPTNAQSGNWGVDLKVKMLRNNSSAPTLESVEIGTV